MAMRRGILSGDSPRIPTRSFIQGSYTIFLALGVGFYCFPVNTGSGYGVATDQSAISLR